MDEVTYIYIIAHEESGGPDAPIKVGIAANPFARLKTLQTGNPKPLCLYATFKLPKRNIAKGLEGVFHLVKGEDRLAGEWFNIPPREATAMMNLFMVLEAVNIAGVTLTEAAAVIDGCQEILAGPS